MAAVRDSGRNGSTRHDRRGAASITSHADAVVMMMRMMAFKTPASTGADGLGIGMSHTAAVVMMAVTLMIIKTLAIAGGMLSIKPTGHGAGNGRGVAMTMAALTVVLKLGALTIRGGPKFTDVLHSRRGANLMMTLVIAIKNFIIGTRNPGCWSRLAATSSLLAADSASRVRLRHGLGMVAPYALLGDLATASCGAARSTVTRTVDAEAAETDTTPESGARVARGAGRRTLWPIDGNVLAPMPACALPLGAIVLAQGSPRLTACLRQSVITATVRPEVPGDSA